MYFSNKKMKISLPNIKLIQNNNENLIKVIQVSFVLNFYGLINRTPRDLGLLIFSLITFKSSIRKI